MNKKIKIQKTEKELDDTQLITKFTKGCDRSYEKLINRYQSKIYNLALRITRNSFDAEEVLQDVCITIYKKIDGFEGKSKFSSWLYRITVNAAFMKLRKRKNNFILPLDDMASYLQTKAVSQHVTTGAQGDQCAMRSQMKDALECAISCLPEEYRAVFILRDMDGLSNNEVSEILSISTPAVKSRLHRSRMILRKKLHRFYTDYRSANKISCNKELLLQQAA